MTRFCAAIGLILLLAGSASAKDLEIYFIDVEGGQATLLVTPTGETLLIDTGYGGTRGTRDADRIMAAAKAAGVSRIDYLLITHFHPDHVGGLPALAPQIPIGTFIDYGAPMGSDRMASGGFRAYEPIREGHPHLTPQPGDRLPLKGIETEVVSAAGTVLSKPLPGAGHSNAACATLENQVEDGTENFRSIGVLFRLGAFRFLDLGDLSGNTLGRVVCPRNLIGKVSVYLVAHHANYDSAIPALVSALQPQVAVLNNGPIKGGDPVAFTTLRAQSEIDLWQLHASRNPGAENAADDFLANVDDGSSSYWIKLTASEDGRFTLTNGRTGFTKQYKAAKQH